MLPMLHRPLRVMGCSVRGRCPGGAEVAHGLAVHVIDVLWCREQAEDADRAHSDQEPDHRPHAAGGLVHEVETNGDSPPKSAPAPW